MPTNTTFTSGITPEAYCNSHFNDLTPDQQSQVELAATWDEAKLIVDKCINTLESVSTDIKQMKDLHSLSIGFKSDIFDLEDKFEKKRTMSRVTTGMMLGMFTNTHSRGQAYLP